MPKIPKKNTTVNYRVLLSRFNEQFSERNLQSITPEEILTFLNHLNGNTKQTTKRLRYALLNAFFNLVKNTLDEKMPNPCDMVMLRKIFRSTRGIQWTIFEKETIDEIIFKTTKLRNRLMLELMARGGMRIGS